MLSSAAGCSFGAWLLVLLLLPPLPLPLMPWALFQASLWVAPPLLALLVAGVVLGKPANGTVVGLLEPARPLAGRAPRTRGCRPACA